MTEIKVLLVDDDRAINFLNQIILKDSGFNCTVDVALNGSEALDMIKGSSVCPDVILLDINMPVMDGFGFLQGFKEMGKCYGNSRVYMLTSSLRDSDRDEALGYECVKSYLEKPLTAQTVATIFS